MEKTSRGKDRDAAEDRGMTYARWLQSLPFSMFCRAPHTDAVVSKPQAIKFGENGPRK